MASEAVFGLVCDAARALGVTEVEAIEASHNEALTRFANNAIHQNVAERARHLSVRALVDGRTARASTNRLDRESIREVVAQAVALARACETDPDLLPLAEPALCPQPARWFESTAQATPGERAAAVAEAIRVVEAAGQTAAGIYSTGETKFCAAELARRGGASSRDHGAILHHGHGRRQFRLGQSQRLRFARPGPGGAGPIRRG